MRFAVRDISFKSTSEKTFDLLSGDNAVGRVYGAKLTKNGLSPQYAAINCNFTGVPQGVTAGYASVNGDIFLYAEGVLYAAPQGQTEFAAIAQGFDRCPYFVERGADLLIGGSSADYVYSGGTITQKEAQVSAYEGVYHYGRLFCADAAEDYMVRWSAAGSDDDWSSGLRYSGWLKLPPERGKILRLVPYNDRLIAVREFGLTAIKAYGETQSFRIVNTDTGFAAVTDGTAAVCADKLFFAAGSGLYAYDGSDIERVAEEGLEGAGEVICGAACGNTYFAAVYVGGNKVTACVDGESGDVVYCNFAADCMFARGKLYAVSDGQLYTLEYGANNALYDSGFTDLGERGRKFLKSVYIDCGGGCDLTVEGGGASRTFSGVKGNVSVKMAGEKFRFTLSAGCAVKSIAAVYEI
ncbi:MAG: hypothetical protein LUF82_03280 [Clostridia bacterium]|nr:hypothetical protein [Clostridia bacterium]